MLPIHVISLADAQQRRERAQRELDRHSLDFRFFDALDGETGAELFDRCDEDAFVLHTGRLPSRGEIGCFASHKALWQRCAAQGEPLLVMEDDFTLSDEFAAAVEAAGELVGELGLVRLQDERRGASKPVMRYRGFQLERYTKTPHCTMCYALNPTVARRLVELHSEFRAPVDVVMKHVWTFDNPMYCLTPYTVSGSDLSFESDIGQREKCPKSPGMSSRRFLLKAGWQWQRLRFNLAQSDGWIRQRFSARAADDDKAALGGGI